MPYTGPGIQQALCRCTGPRPLPQEPHCLLSGHTASSACLGSMEVLSDGSINAGGPALGAERGSAHRLKEEHLSDESLTSWEGRRAGIEGPYP